MRKIEQLISDNTVEPRHWSQPSRYKLANDRDTRNLEAMLETADGSVEVIDPVEAIADDLFEMNFPNKVDNDEARHRFATGIHEQGAGFGTWHYFPWSSQLVRFPDAEDHRELRTFRNKDLITADEQRKLDVARAAVIGMSVGSAVAERLVIGGTVGSVLYADADRLSVPNLNRINATMGQVGMHKVDIAAIKTSELDPYIHQVHLRQGLRPDTLATLQAFHPDVVFDEVDDLGAKVLLRQFAQEHRLPLIMASDVGEKSIIDVERYDIDPRTKPFHGKISLTEMEYILSGQMTDAEKKKFITKTIGIRNASSRLLGSLVQIGKTLGGFPQLGSAASMGGAMSELFAREIILGRGPETGRTVVSPRKLAGMAQPDPFSVRFRTVKSALKSSK